MGKNVRNKMIKLNKTHNPDLKSWVLLPTKILQIFQYRTYHLDYFDIGESQAPLEAVLPSEILF